MATQQPPRQEPEKKKGLIGTALSIPLRIFGIALASLFLSLVFEWIGLTFFWNDEGWKHSQDMFNTELGWLSDTFKQSLVIREPGRTASMVLNTVYEWAFEKTGFIAFTQQARLNALQGGFTGGAASIYLVIEDYALASIYVVMTFVIRLLVLVLSIPMFVMAMLVGLTDGLVRRDLRRFGAGRESSFIYHRAKRLVVPLIIAPWIIYLSCPVTVYPVLVLIPCAVALGLAVLITSATFKKYL